MPQCTKKLINCKTITQIIGMDKVTTPGFYASISYIKTFVKEKSSLSFYGKIFSIYIYYSFSSVDLCSLLKYQFERLLKNKKSTLQFFFNFIF